MNHKIILASESPRRKELFRQLGLSFQCVPSGLEEDMSIAEDPAAFAENMAVLKARALAEKEGTAAIIGADTVVAIEKEILGKPETPDRAVDMLRLLNGKAHRVITGVAVINQAEGVIKTGSKITEVQFNHVSEKQILEYVKTGEPMDKAGAYAIQGEGRFLIQSIEGCFSNVVGLPLCLLMDFLREAGIREGNDWNTVAAQCCRRKIL